jgi:2-polyprenyl-6-methoxyphenol hydroxylase-like FAD-dependent oxidoreductase
MPSRTQPTIGESRAYDAIVVGARPAGAATAMLLARAGRRVLLVDRAEYASDTLSTHALMRGGVMQLHRWGVLDAVRDAGTPPIRRTVFHYGDERVDIEMRELHGVDTLYAPRRTLLDRVLVDAARDAGAEVVWGVRVHGLERDSGGRVRGVWTETDSMSEAFACAPIVIGADGMGSTIARLVDAPVEYETSSASAFIYGYFEGLESAQYDWYYQPGVSAGVIPTNGGLANVFAGLPPGRFVAERHRGVKSIFASVLDAAAPEVAETLRDRSPAGRFRSFPGRNGYLRRAHGPGWALVGDAGYFKDPMTAHGITDALRDAELLTRALLESPVHAPDASSYQTVRDALARPFMDVTAAAASYGWTLAELQAMHLELKRATDPEIALLAALGDPLTLAA